MNSGFALVTGAGSGIGAATAVALASRDLHVVAVSRRPESLTRHQHFPRVRDHLELIPADLTKPDEVESVFSQAESGPLPIRYVVHSVGFAYDVGWYRDAKPSDVLAALSSLIASPALVLNRALQALRSRGGNIGLVSSGAASRATPGRAVYSSSKIALNRLVESVAAECEADQADTGVFAILPGRVDTPAQRRLMRTARDADPAFRLGRFRSTADVWPADAVGEAIASLVLRPSTELNGRILRYHPDGWRNTNS